MLQIEATSTVAGTYAITSTRSPTSESVRTDYRGPIFHEGRTTLRTLTLAAAILAASDAYAPVTAPAGPSELASHFGQERRGEVFIERRYLSALEEMESYRQLQDGWDGLDSVSPKDDVIDDAATFLENLPSGLMPPDATASADGLVGWFWRTPQFYASLTFLGEHRYAYFARSKVSGQSAKGIGYADRNSIPNDLLQLLQVA